jgi:hypothetical protein
MGEMSENASAAYAQVYLACACGAEARGECGGIAYSEVVYGEKKCAKKERKMGRGVCRTEISYYLSEFLV